MELLPKIHYKGDFDDFDTEMKGYRNDTLVELPNGDLFEVFFYDTVRLVQDFGDGPYLSHPGLIILGNVNKKSIEEAVIDLWKRGYFGYFKPRLSKNEKHFDENI